MNTTSIHHTPWRVVYIDTDDELLEGTGLTHQGRVVSFAGIESLPRAGRPGQVLLDDGRFVYAASPLEMNLVIERRDDRARKDTLQEVLRAEGAASAAVLARYIEGQHRRAELAGHLAKAVDESHISIEYLRRLRGRAAAVTGAAFRLTAADVVGSAGSVLTVAALAEQHGTWGADATIVAAVEHVDAALSWARQGSRSAEYLAAVPAPIDALVDTYWSVPGAELALPSSAELDDLQAQLDRLELEAALAGGTPVDELLDADAAAAIARLGFAGIPSRNEPAATPPEGRPHLAPAPAVDDNLSR